MRNCFTPEIDTCEISDSELDTIAGGIASAGGEVAGHGAAVSVGNVVGTAQSLAPTLPVSSVAGLVTVQTTGL
ncbi:hypothetical protein Sgleb_13370 [Streptomyces glebosus]|uniref:Type A2 lantipeptide n=1 Tax=Streptomyces glebosus TaxID=249580 RepID=A0A640SQL6_9ACTN|nr:hypothetical protein [Streptomyces glebosus]GFE13290.1 hypothetical protein Sgleb_13370 [Streptomyces glebosus]GHG66616.1 hypothetical protein GCM10010513_35940 [Streptomyces glebosus]